MRFVCLTHDPGAALVFYINKALPSKRCFVERNGSLKALPFVLHTVPVFTQWRSPQIFTSLLDGTSMY